MNPSQQDPGSRTRIGSVTDDGSTGGTVQVRFQNATFTEASGATISYTNRAAGLVWVGWIGGTKPSVGDKLFCRWIGERWFACG